MKQTLFLIFGILFLASCQTRQKKATDGDSENAGLKLPEGFSASVFADKLGNARHLDVNTNGDVYVSLSHVKNGGGLVCLRDEDMDGHADVIKYHGIYEGTGIGLHNGYLYFGTDTLIIRFKLTEGELIPAQDAEIVVSGFSPQNQHETKPMTFDQDGNMYVTVGAPSNACQEQDRTKVS